MNSALASSYVEKTGKSEEEILKLMDRETWLTANQALEIGFVDEIIHDERIMMTNQVLGMRLTDEIRQKVIAEKGAQESIENEKKNLLSDLDLYGV